MKNFFQTALATAAICATSLTAVAAGTPLDFGQIELNKDYTIPGNGFFEVSAWFVAPETGTLVVNSGNSGQLLPLYANEDHTVDVPATNDNATSTQYIFYDVTAGNTYYLYQPFSMVGSTFYICMAKDLPLEIMYIDPTPGSIVDYNNYPNIQITLNQSATVGSAGMIMYQDRLTGKQGMGQVSVKANGSIVNITNVYNTIKPLLQSGALKVGDEYSIYVQNLKSTAGGKTLPGTANGMTEFKYKCGNIPVILTKQVVPTEFESYWPAGTEAAKMQLTFNANIKADAESLGATLGYGDLEGPEGSYYVENIPLKVEGNTIYADFSGKLRTPQTMTPLFATTVYPTVTLQVYGIVDEYGVPVGSTGQGTVGSYSYSIPYNLIKYSIVSSEFTPGTGASLSGATEIEAYITGLDGISFDGFLLSTEDSEETLVIPMSEVEKEEDNGDDAVFYFTIPAEWAAKKSLNVTLNNVVSLDGYDHSNDIRVIYNGFALVSANPVNGSEFDVLADGTKITIVPNSYRTYPDLYIEYEIEDLQPVNPEEPILKSYSWMNRQANGSYTAEVVGNYKMVLGHEYKVNFTAWPSEAMMHEDPTSCLGSDYVIWKGLSAPFSFSPVTLTGVEPAMGEDVVLPSEKTDITLKFDGLVSITADKAFILRGMNFTEPFEAITPSEGVEEEGVTYANEWTLTVSESYMSQLTAALQVSVQAVDQDGKLVEGNTGYEEQCFFLFTWDVEGQFSDYEVVVNNGITPIPSFDEFVVKHEAGIYCSWLMPENTAYVTDANGSQVAAVKEAVDAGLEDFDAPNPYMTLMLDKAVDKAGHYTIHIPAGYFVIGQEYNQFTSAEMNVEVEVSGQSAVEGVAAEADTYTVYGIDGVKLLDGADAVALKTLAPGLYIINGKKIKI